MKIKSELYYSNVELYKYNIYKENRRKSGIYRWKNLITGKSYIGSAINLSNRLNKYFSPNFLKKCLLRSKSRIYSSLLKYGYVNFTLEILEYCKPIFLIEREQYYIDLLKPEYNICKIAGSTFGKKHTIKTKEAISLASKGRRHSPETIAKLKSHKHSIETIAKLRGRKRSPETIAKIKVARAKQTHLWKINLLLAVGHTVTVTNIKDNSVRIYASMREAARNLEVSHTTIRQYVNTNKILKNIYLIKKYN